MGSCNVSLRYIRRSFIKESLCAGNTTGESISDKHVMKELKQDLKVVVQQQGELLGEFQQQARTSQQLSQLVQVLLLSQFQPAASTASTKESAVYCTRALDHYNLAGDQEQSFCMVTGDQVATAQLTAGHIYRQAWPGPILVRLRNPTIAPCMLVQPTAWSTVCYLHHVLTVLHVRSTAANG